MQIPTTFAPEVPQAVAITSPEAAAVWRQMQTDLADAQTTAHQNGRLHFCAWCETWFGPDWREAHGVLIRPESHGICPSCRDNQLRGIRSDSFERECDRQEWKQEVENDDRAGGAQ